MVKTRHVFLHLRHQGRPLIVLQVRSFDFFRLGLTEVFSTGPILAHLKGRQFQSLGQAAQEIHAKLFGRDAGYSQFMSEYEAYCIGHFDEVWDACLGKAQRKIVTHGQEFEQPFSPDLLNKYVELAPDSLAPGGRWVACCTLLPLVPLGVPDSDAAARLAREMLENRHHSTAGSRNCTGSSSRTDAAAGTSRRAHHHDSRSGHANPSYAPDGAAFRSPAHAGDTQHTQAPIKRAPKRARFCTKEGLCVYRLADDMNTPHEIVSHCLVEQAVPGRQSMKMLKLRPLRLSTAHPPDVDVPAVETVPLHDRFKSVWEAHTCDAKHGEPGSTGRTVANAAVYDAHIRAVKLQARMANLSEWQLFHEMRWGRGCVAYAPTPPELAIVKGAPELSG